MVQLPADKISRQTEPSGCDPDLKVILNAWESLPDALRTGILAMVKAATKR